MRGGELKHAAQEVARGPAARGDPQSQQARLRRADGGVAQDRARAAAPRVAWQGRRSRRADCCRGRRSNELMRLHDDAREDYTDVLLVLMNLELWCRLFIDGRDAHDVGGELAELMAALIHGDLAKESRAQCGARAPRAAAGRAHRVSLRLRRARERHRQPREWAAGGRVRPRDHRPHRSVRIPYANQAHRTSASMR